MVFSPDGILKNTFTLLKHEITPCQPNLAILQKITDTFTKSSLNQLGEKFFC